MVDNYTQAVEVTVGSKAKALQWSGIFFVLFSFGFIAVSAFYSWYFMFAFAVFFAVGIVNIHFYNRVAKEFFYEFSPTRFTVVKKDVVNKQTTVLSLLLKDAISFGIMTDMFDEGKGKDMLCCDKAYDRGVYQITFGLKDGTTRKVLFAPDDYMVALLNEALVNCNK